MLKIFSKILVLIGFVSILTMGWLSYTCGYRLDKIKAQDFENLIIKTGDFDLDSMLSQRFHFLSKGRHTFVFRSEDDKYVIKFFRFHRYKTSVFFQIFKSMPYIDKYIIK